MKIATPPPPPLEKSCPLFPSNPHLKVEVLLSPPLFWKFGWRLNPPVKGGYTLCLTNFSLLIRSYWFFSVDLSLMIFPIFSLYSMYRIWLNTNDISFLLIKVNSDKIIKFVIKFVVLPSSYYHTSCARSKSVNYVMKRISTTNIHEKHWP